MFLNFFRHSCPPVVRHQGLIKWGEICEMVLLELHQWHMQIRKCNFAHLLFAASGLLKDKTLELLSSVGPFPLHERLEKVLAGQWKWYLRHVEELFVL